MKRLQVLPLALCLAGPALAQGQGPPPTVPPSETMIPWPAGLGSGALTKATGMFLDDTFLLSAIGLRGTTLGQAVAPAFFPAIVPLDVGHAVVDLVTLATGGLGGRDALLLTVQGPHDLVLVMADAAGDLQAVPVPHPGWAQATCLAAMGDPFGIDVFGKAAAGNVLLRTRYDYATQSFLGGPSITTGSAIRDLAPVEFDGDLVNDIAALTDTGLDVYGIGGTLLFSRSLPHPGGAVELAGDASERDHLALLYRNPAGSGWELIHISTAGTEAPVAVTFDGADFTLVGMAAGDVNADGHRDLVIQKQGNMALIVLNAGAAPHFPSPAAVPPLTIGNLGGLQAPASVRDYDRDGAADILAALTTVTGDNYLVMNAGLPSLIDAEAPQLPDLVYEGVSVWDNAADCLKLRITLKSEEYAAYDHIRVVGWTGVDLPPGVNMIENAVLHRVFTILEEPTSFPAHFELEVKVAAGASPLRDSLTWNRLLYLVVQLYDADTGSPGGVAPTWIVGGTMDPTGNQIFSEETLVSDLYPNAAVREIREPPTPRGPGRLLLGVIMTVKGAPLKQKGTIPGALPGVIRPFQ